jgi:hypothetical protein
VRVWGKRPGSILAAFAALGPAAPGIAVAVPQPAGQETASPVAQASALVRLVNPPATMLEINLRGWESGVAQTVALDPIIQKLETEHPGVSKAVIDAARPLAAVYLKEFVRRGSARKAAILAERLTPAEISQLQEFFRTPAGLKIVERTLSSVDVTPLAREMAEKGAQTGTVSASREDVTKVVTQAARKAMADVSATDQIAMLRFMQTPVAAKFGAASAEADRELLDMANNPDPAFLKEQQDAMIAALLAYVDRDAPKAK